MDLWFSEHHTPNTKLSIKVNRQLYSAQSDYQRIDVFESDEYGRFLTLDGFMMTTQKDEFIYHEMITHVPMAVNPNIRSVLVIGGGDGGVVTQLVKYPAIEKIHLVEIDKMVVDACKEFLPDISEGFSDPRVTVFYQDGLKFVRTRENEYDLIIVDSTDPFGPGEGLFTKEFYGNCSSALTKDGILVNQNESPFYKNDAIAMMRAHRRIAQTFPVCRVYQVHIPTYPSGYWLFGFASLKYHPVKDFNESEWTKLAIKTRYYNPGVHKGAFYLPTYVQELLEKTEEDL